MSVKILIHTGHSNPRKVNLLWAEETKVTLDNHAGRTEMKVNPTFYNQARGAIQKLGS